LRAKKEELLQEVYTVITATLGVPIRPDQIFTWEYYEDGPGGNGKAKVWRGTPREFYANIAQGKYKVRRSYPLNNDTDVCIQPKESFSLINDPRNGYNKLYTVENLGNVWGGRPVLCTSF
jgi:bleomycin hydrolase